MAATTDSAKHLAAIRANTRALQALASAQEAVANQMRIANMFTAAGYSTSAFSTSNAYQKALHTHAIDLIGVRP